MKHALLLTSLIAITITAASAQSPSPAPALAPEPPASPALYTIPSWGDFAVVYANGIDSAMDTQQGMENMFKLWRDRGFTGVFLRSDLQQYDPYVIRHGKSQMNPSLALMWRHVDKIGEHFDYFTAAQAASEKTGLQFWMYHPHLYSEGAPPHAGEEGPGRMVPWSYESKVLADHPEMVTIDRRGNKYWMVPEYAYPEVRKQKAAEFVHMAKKYGLKHFIANMRSEVSQLQAPADHADRFGFNQPVVDDMKKLHGVDIMTDPRFDVDSPTFDSKDPMVQKWRDLRGEYLTQFFRELRAALKAYDPKIELAITIAGDSIGPPLGNWTTAWRTWVDEGLMDYIISPVYFEASLDHDADKKGYLTHSRIGIGRISYEDLRAYISKSKHPETKIIATGGPSFFFTPTPVPAGADGMQCDAWYGAYHRAAYQRWDQFQKDVRDFGHIKFIDQNFDKVSPEEYAMPSGGWGEMAYVPALRACPGAWWRLGTGADSKPFAQSSVRRGDSGQAMQLTHSADGKDTLTGWHNTSPDRSKWAGAIDTSMTSGHATFDFWIKRETAESSVAAFLQGDPTLLEVGVRIAPVTGKISYSTGTEKGTGKWVETEHTMPAGQWQQFHIDVDIDHLQYSASTGANKLCESIPLTKPKERFVELNGVGIPMAVPTFKEFKNVLFTPGGKPGSITYVDDVDVRWIPDPVFSKPGDTVLFSDDFESYPHATSIDSPALKSKWQQDASTPNDLIIRDTSFGPGVKSLRLHGGGALTALTHQPITHKKGDRLTMDVDLFIRSGEPLPSIMPATATKFPHGATLGWTDSAGKLVAAIKSENGTWHLLNGSAEWTDTQRPVHYDMWNHLQLVLTETGDLQAAAQPVGQVPAPIATAKPAAAPGDTPAPLRLTILPTPTAGHLTCYDNLKITSGPAAKK